MSLEHSPARQHQHQHPHLTTDELCARWRINKETLSARYRKLGLRPIKVAKRLLFPIEQVERVERDSMVA